MTIAGFIPVGFASSAVAEYAGGIFWVVAIALVVSWFVAVIFTPYLGVKLLPNFNRDGKPHDPYQGRLYRALRAVLDYCIRNRLKVVALTAGLFAAAVVGFGNVQQQFFPLSERPELFLQLRLPEGSSITATTRMVEEAEALLDGDPDVALDLQAVLDQTYEAGSYADRIDYGKPCVPPLNPDDQAWADDRIRQARGDP